MKFKRNCIVMLVLIMIISSLSACTTKGGKETNSKTPTPSESSNGPVELDFATFSMGSIWYSYGATLVEVMKEGLPEGSRINMLDRAGGMGNPILVGDGEVELGLTYPSSAKWAYNGTEPYTDKARDGLRAICGGFDEIYFGMIASKKSGITNLGELVEKKQKINLMALPPGGQGELLTKFTLKTYGVTYDDIKSWGGTVEHTDYNTILDAFKDGKADFFMQTIAQGQPAATELAITTPVTFVPMDEENIQKMVDDYGVSRIEIPAGSFHGQDSPVPTVGLSSNLVTHKDVPEEIVYGITKALIEGVEKLHKGHNSLKHFDPQKAASPDLLGIPLHPGAERYFREAGIIK